MKIPNDLITQTVTIAADASLSGATALRPGYTLVGLLTDAAWDEAKITFAGSNDGANFYPVRSATDEYEVAAVTGAACVAVDPDMFRAWRYLKVRSGTSAVATNQADATTVTLVYQPV